MYKVENKSISISNVKSKNRILNNYLDWVLFSMLPYDIARTLFPRFIYPATPQQNYAMETAYIEVNTPQVITDTSTEMDYTEGVFSNELTTDETTTPNGKIITVFYPNTVPTLVSGDTFEAIGFGRMQYDSGGVPYQAFDYLLAYMDVSASGMVYSDTQDYGITRVDEITTDEKLVSGDYSYLPGELRGILTSISMCYSDDGTYPYKEYLLSDLTFAVVGVGNVSVTGFDDFFYETGVLYPKTTLYPSTTLYPTQPSAQIKSVRFKYSVWSVGGGNYGICETYIAIKDLNVSYSGTDMSINLVCERG